MRARAIMVLGTGSHVGKSLMVAALCRIFAQRGVRVAPFKSQNMSLNSAATIEGLEIGRAQALQAEAAGVPASVHMNPILLKPSGGMRSQIVVRGKIWGTLSASDYHLRRVEELLPLVRESYETLAAVHDVIILEGAGSPAEINLKQHDIVNMRMAELADAKCILFGDIDRGGVFASLLGTVELLDAEEQGRISGFAINKFRGDLKLLEPGLRMMEERIQKPCLGVVPYLQDLVLDEEDSLGLSIAENAAWESSGSHGRTLRIAVIALPSFSNFTDFDALQAEPSVSLCFARAVDQLCHADIVILPGSKQTVDDLLWLRERGFDQVLLDHARTGLVVGICGGMQMLGERISDPSGVEHRGMVDGLGLLPIQTTMLPSKVTSLTQGRLVASSLFGQDVSARQLSGYEIHIGETTYLDCAKPFAEIHRGDGSLTQHYDGCVAADGRIFGTYLHGLFDQDDFRHAFIQAARSFYGLTAAEHLNDWKAMRESSLNRLAAEVEQALDMQEIFAWAGYIYATPNLDSVPGTEDGVVQ
jgi:adenosylcobyric acid synthase